MESTERAQVRLILEHRRLAIQRTCHKKLQALYADYAAKGCLQFGATAKPGMRIINDLGETFVKMSVDQVASVAMDTDAFAMIVEETESLFRVFAGEVDTLTKKVTDGGNADGQRSVANAVQKLFQDAHKKAMRQLEIHRFTFTKSSMGNARDDGRVNRTEPKLAVSKPMPARPGRLPADWWDDLWIEIFRQVYLGDLKPKSQADIVKAMQQWLSNKDIDAADSTLKPRARKLLQMLQATDG